MHIILSAHVAGEVNNLLKVIVALKDKAVDPFQACRHACTLVCLSCHDAGCLRLLIIRNYIDITYHGHQMSDLLFVQTVVMTVLL